MAEIGERYGGASIYDMGLGLTAQCSVSQAVSKNATKPLATLSSVHVTAALELLATAFVCTVSYCRFSRCNSGNVTLRMGRCRISDPVGAEAGGEGIRKESAVGIAWI